MQVPTVGTSFASGEISQERATELRSASRCRREKDPENEFRMTVGSASLRLISCRCERTSLPTPRVHHRLGDIEKFVVDSGG
jgi:hypothetical protein